MDEQDTGATVVMEMGRDLFSEEAGGMRRLDEGHWERWKKALERGDRKKIKARLGKGPRGPLRAGCETKRKKLGSLLDPKVNERKRSILQGTTLNSYM